MEEETWKLAPDTCILIEGPRWPDTEFFGRWLLAANQANKLLKLAAEDKAFRPVLEDLAILFKKDIEIAAMIFLERLGETFPTALIGLGEWEAEEVAIMAELGFYKRSGDRYQMALPGQLDVECVKRAMAKLRETEKPEGYFHPEELVHTIPVSVGKTWQERLKQMDEEQRLADRNALLCSAMKNG